MTTTSTEKRKKKDYQLALPRLLETLNILTIILPLLTLLGFGIAMSVPGLWPVGYYLVKIIPILTVVLLVGLIVAMTNVVIVPFYIIKRKLIGRPKLIGWVVVCFSVMYVVSGSFISLTLYISNQNINKIFTREEAMSLINNCQVGALLRRPDDSTQVIGRDKSTAVEFKANISHISTGAFDELRLTAKDTEPRCGPIEIRE